MTSRLDVLAGRHLLQRGLKAPLAAWLARPFGRRTACRLAIYYEPNSISFTQVFPFLWYADRFRARFGVQMRAHPSTGLVAGHKPRADDADVVLFQIWFDTPPDRMNRAIDLLRAAHPRARLVFVDAFAHSDLRLAHLLEPQIDLYLKKSRFRNPDDVFRAWRGDTNLTEYYSDLYGLPAAPVDWQVPAAILPKLRLSPNFFTAPRFLPGFIRTPMPGPEGRDLDIQTRFGIRGTPWYQAMRQHALDRVRAIDGLALSPPDRVSYAQYMQEMRRSRLCFSPHGYGELCWRDVEGVMAGAVLIKPDMSHLETAPDIYRPGETYLPCRWDFSDLETVVRQALADPALCARLTSNAHAVIAGYLREARFVDDMAFLFDG